MSLYCMLEIDCAATTSGLTPNRTKTHRLLISGSMLQLMIGKSERWVEQEMINLHHMKACGLGLFNHIVFIDLTMGGGSVGKGFS